MELRQSHQASGDPAPASAAAAGVGLPPDRFMSHSLRIGGASALFQATADIELVKRMGRRASSAVQSYLFDGGTVTRSALLRGGWSSGRRTRRRWWPGRAGRPQLNQKG